MPHIHAKIDFTVEVFIVHGNKVLLRLHDKYAIWLSVGGHVELDEDPNQAAIREVKEEVGLDIDLAGAASVIDMRTKDHIELIPPKFLNIHRINATHQHIGMVYFATAKSDRVIPERLEDQWKWVTKEELPAMDLKQSIRHYAEKALLELAR